MGIRGLRVGLPIVGGLVLLLAPKSLEKNRGLLARWLRGVVYRLSLGLWFYFDSGVVGYQFVEEYSWLAVEGAKFGLGVDGISLFLVVLNSFLMFFCIRRALELKFVRRPSKFFSYLRIREGLVSLVFLSLDLLCFYVAYEAVLLPMFRRIGEFGSGRRKIRAGYLFFRYTFVGSLLMLLGRMVLYQEGGSLDLVKLGEVELSERVQKWLFLAFFASFMVKVPRVPFHVWLPAAHVEAPTAGSVVLAGVLLKLGTYGLLRISVPLFPLGMIYFRWRVCGLACIRVLYGSLTALRQGDLKRVIAYSSVAHIGVTVVGICSLQVEGIEGAVRQMVSHGIVSGALFFCVGVLYDRGHSRRLRYFSGRMQTIPLFGIIFLRFMLGNIGIPGTAGFIGERDVRLGLFQRNRMATRRSIVGMVLGAGYSLWALNRVVYGNRKTEFEGMWTDLNRRERVILGSLVVVIRVLGIYPERLLKEIHVRALNLLEGVRSMV